MQRKITAITPVKRLIPKRKKDCCICKSIYRKRCDATLAFCTDKLLQILHTKPQRLGIAGIYADEAITGTKETRPELQKMITACENGEIDMIITKSISRFARKYRNHFLKQSGS